MTQLPPPPPSQLAWQPVNPPAPPVPSAAAPPPAKRSWFARHKILTGLGVLVLLGVLMTALNGGGNTAATTNASGSKASTAAVAPEAGAAAGLNTAVRDGKFEFTVTKVKAGVASVGSEFLAEKAQGQFVLVSITVKNIGDEAQTLVDSEQKVTDTSGRTFSPNSAAGVYIEGNSVLFSEINPGNSLKGILVYDMPKGAKAAQIELHDSMLSDGVTVKL